MNYAQVGALVVSKDKAILGEGWNRMPAGCEDRFTWSKGDDDVLKTKYPYGKHTTQCHANDNTIEILCITKTSSSTWCHDCHP